MAHTVSDGEHFTVFPLWEEMDLTRDCKAYGNWYSTHIDPNPCDKSHYLDGDTSLIIEYFNTSLPPSWTMPKKWTYADYVGTVLDWYGQSV